MIWSSRRLSLGKGMIDLLSVYLHLLQLCFMSRSFLWGGWTGALIVAVWANDGVLTRPSTETAAGRPRLLRDLNAHIAWIGPTLTRPRVGHPLFSVLVADDRFGGVGGQIRIGT